MSLFLKDIQGNNAFYTALRQERDGDLVLTEKDLEIAYGLVPANEYFVDLEKALAAGDAREAKRLLGLMEEARARRFTSTMAQVYDILREKGTPVDQYDKLEEPQRQEIETALIAGFDLYLRENYPHAESYLWDSQMYEVRIPYYIHRGSNIGKSDLQTDNVLYSIASTPEAFVQQFDEWSLRRYSPDIDRVIQTDNAFINYHELNPAPTAASLEKKYGFDLQINGLMEVCSEDAKYIACPDPERPQPGSMISGEELKLLESTLSRLETLRPDDIKLLKGMKIVLSSAGRERVAGEYYSDKINGKKMVLYDILDKSEHERKLKYASQVAQQTNYGHL